MDAELKAKQEVPNKLAGLRYGARWCGPSRCLLASYELWRAALAMRLRVGGLEGA
jgi:hypothetical protein